MLREVSSKNQNAFTLLELMIVVGVLSIFAMLAVPKFTRFQAKARQSEAKIGLAGIYTAERTFFGEYSAFYPSMNAVGFMPDGQKRNYNIGFQDNTTGTAPASVIGYNGATDIPFYSALNNTMTCTTNYPLNGVTSGEGQAFVASAVGCIINGGAAMDFWTMSDGKILFNVSTGY